MTSRGGARPGAGRPKRISDGEILAKFTTIERKYRRQAKALSMMRDALTENGPISSEDLETIGAKLRWPRYRVFETISRYELIVKSPKHRRLVDQITQLERVDQSGGGRSDVGMLSVRLIKLVQAGAEELGWDSRFLSADYQKRTGLMRLAIEELSTRFQCSESSIKRAIRSRNPRKKPV